MANKNHQAKMMIYDALPQKELERVCMCKTAKEIWDLLLFVHDDTTQVKVEETRSLEQLSLEKIIDDLSEYEAFLDDISVITMEETDSLDLEDEVTTSQTSNQDASLDKDDGVDDEVTVATRELNKQGRSNDQEIAFIRAVLSNSEDGNQSHGESICLTTLEVLEVSSNTSSSNYNIHIVQKPNEELIKLIKHILRSIDNHTIDKHKVKNEINKLKQKMICFKFKKSGFDLNKILSEQKPFHDKGGLGIFKNDKNTSARQDKSIVFIKEGHESKITDTDALADASTRNKRARSLSKDRSPLNAFAKPFFPQKPYANINNTLHDFIEPTNDEHGSNLDTMYYCTSSNNCSSMFTKVDCTISKNGNILAKGRRRNNLYIV